MAEGWEVSRVGQPAVGVTRKMEAETARASDFPGNWFLGPLSPAEGLGDT